ncbi:MAG: NAD-dependent succinate-semialdehyde dehydrogenase [Deltaproteobacteria bacterium]|nr:NAD-dependent succinate-semialdehyde dehydrogenase [Deltaproteobacteria bacterium]
MVFESVNPATGERLKSYPELSTAEALRQVEALHQNYRQSRERSRTERIPKLKKLAHLLQEGKSRYASLITQEMGKPIAQAEAEIEKCAWATDFYADKGIDFLKETPVKTDASKSLIRYDPLGIILAIMPWNFPFWQVFRCAVPAILAGNAVLLKHAPNVPACALAIEELFQEAGLGGLFQSLFIDLETTARLIESPVVRGISLTGSDRAGSAVASLAGKHLKKVILELGGSDPFIVLDDANLELAVPAAIQARIQNSGQSCIAAKRFLVAEKIADRFEEAVIASVRRQRVGDPLDRSVTIGPIAREDLLVKLMKQVDESRACGAKLAAGGERLQAKGFFYLPTVLLQARPGMTVFDEETFGPVVVITRVQDDEEAIRLANQTAYGLGASLWTNDLKRAEPLISKIEAGSVFVNGAVHSDPRLPFGGIKRSGIGRELGREGILEFTNIKTVWIR